MDRLRRWLEEVREARQRVSGGRAVVHYSLRRCLPPSRSTCFTDTGEVQGGVVGSKSYLTVVKIHDADVIWTLTSPVAAKQLAAGAF